MGKIKIVQAGSRFIVGQTRQSHIPQPLGKGFRFEVCHEGGCVPPLHLNLVIPISIPWQNFGPVKRFNLIAHGDR
jgi:hypothetical protein